MSLLQRTRPSDDVDRYECSANDLVGKAFVLTFCFVIPLRLSPESLKSALFSTIQDKIKRVGARLVRRDTFEFHVPKVFSERDPPCAFSSRSIDDTLSQLPLPPTLAECDQDNPCFFSSLSPDIAAYFRPTPCPSSLKDFLQQGIPMLQVHVTTFTDATLIGVSAPHILFDVHGAKMLLSAWAATFRGEASTVVQVPVDFAPLGRRSTTEALKTIEAPPNVAQDEPIRGFFVLGLWSTMLFVFYLVLRIVKDSQEVDIMIRIPKKWVQKQKDEIMVELQQRGSQEWVSTSDIVLAWIFRTVHMYRTDSTPVALHSAVNLRGVLPETFSAPYIHNAVHAVVVRPPIPAVQLGSQPIGDTALALRRALQKLKGDVPSLLVELADQAAHPNRTLFPALPGEEWAIATNWLSARFLDLDFGGVHPTWFTAFRQDRVNLPLRGTGTIRFEDEDAIWAAWTMSRNELSKLRTGGAIRFVDP